MTNWKNVCLESERTEESFGMDCEDVCVFTLVSALVSGGKESPFMKMNTKDYLEILDSRV